MTLSSAPFYHDDPAKQAQSSKVCVICDVEQPLTNFSPSNGGRNRRSRCKKCRIRLRTERAQAQIQSAKITSKLCAKCKINKPLEDFPLCSVGRAGKHSYCKPCKLEDDREYAAARAAKLRDQRRLEYEAMDASLRPIPKTCSNLQCPLAGTVQPPENFRKSKIHRTGLIPDCTICQDERIKRSVERNKEKYRAKSNDRYKNDPEYKEYRQRWYQEHKEELNKRTKQWRQSNPDLVKRLRITRRFRQYGVTQEWYDRTLSEQGGGCAICGSADPKNEANTFHVDHDHSCCSKSCHACDNCRRGLLCSGCNTRLTHLENIEWKTKAIAYLQKHYKK